MFPKVQGNSLIIDYFRLIQPVIKIIMKDKKLLRLQAIQRAKNQISKLTIISKNVNMVKNKLENQQICSPEFDDAKSISCLTFNEKHYPKVADIDTFNEKYQLGKKIGEGSSGVVRQCLHLKRNKIYACKAMMFDDEHIPLLQRNFVDVRKLDHENIVKYKALYLDLEKHLAYLVMEYIDLPPLMDYLSKIRKPINQNEVKWIFLQLFKTLQHMHKKGVSHRDIKPDNIMVNVNTRKIKIIDFGIAKNMIVRKQRIDMLTITGTLFYRAPQMFLGAGYNEKVDIWAAGITLYEVLYGKTPFQSQFHSQTIQNIQNMEIDINLLQSHEKDDDKSFVVKDLIQRLLRKNPIQRFTSEQALQHLWFEKKQLRLQQRYSDVGHIVQTEYSKFKKISKEYDPTSLISSKKFSEIKKSDSPSYHRLEVDDF